MKFRNGKPTEDPLCSKKGKDEMVFSLPLFPFTDFWGVPFFPLFCFFFKCRSKVLYTYIYTYIYVCMFIAQIIYTTRP